jgi:hypothetical protein
LIFVHLEFWGFLLFKRNIYNWIALQWKQLGVLDLMPAVKTALPRQPPFVELALGNKQVFKRDQRSKPWLDMPAFTGLVSYKGSP